VTQRSQLAEAKYEIDSPREQRTEKLRGSSDGSDRTQAPEDELFDEAGAAKFLDPNVGELKPQTLNKWRHRRRGPHYVELGGKIRYRKSDLLAWLNAKTVDPAKKKDQRRARRNRKTVNKKS
jgi:hypothetical protein